VARFEQGLREPVWSTFVRICEALGVPLKAFADIAARGKRKTAFRTS
jgi:hypothetical protein